MLSNHEQNVINDMGIVKSGNVNLNVTKKISLTENWTESYHSKMSIFERFETCKAAAEARNGEPELIQRDLRLVQTNY